MYHIYLSLIKALRAEIRILKRSFSIQRNKANGNEFYFVNRPFSIFSPIPSGYIRYKRIKHTCPRKPEIISDHYSIEITVILDLTRNLYGRYGF